MNQNTTIKGTITSVSAPNHSGWSYGRVKLSDGTSFSVSGVAMSDVKKGGEYELSGTWSTYNGEAQMKVATALPYIAANRAGVINFLVANFKGIGQKKVKEIVDTWESDGRKLEEMYLLLRDGPEVIDEWIQGKGFKNVSMLTQKFQAHPDVMFVYRSLVLKHRVNDLSDTIVSESTLKNMAKYLLGIPLEAAVSEQKPRCSKEEAIKKFEENSFLPIFGVKGYGFKTADKIWKHLKRDPHHPARLAALGWFILEESCQNGGHTYLPAKEFEHAIQASDPTLNLRGVLAALETHTPKDAHTVMDVDGRYYISWLYRAEEAVARRMLRMMNSENGENKIISMSEDKLKKSIEEIEKKRGFPLDSEQRSALMGVALNNKLLHTVTAMPGCGKTAIMEFLSEIIMQDRGGGVMFMAPTGKAAKVLNGRVKKQGLTATTIHSAIGYGNSSKESLTLDANVVVADESSMVDISLMKSLLDALPEDAHLILIGDTDQLPSVGPGQVLSDILKLPLDHHQLHEVHRNTGNILKLVKAIKNGRYERMPESDVQTYGLPDPSMISKVLDKYEEEVRSRSGDLQKVGILTGMRRGDPLKPGWNVTYLNAALQERFNPIGKKIAGTNIREGDRVIVRKNQKPFLLDKSGDVVSSNGMQVQTFTANGDTGVLKRGLVNEEGMVKSVIVDLDDGRSVRLDDEKIRSLDLGYALTVHQAQGSEFECAFVFMTNGVPGLFNRKLLYTAVSRAKEQLYLFGDGVVLRSLVHRTGDKRFTYLSERVQELLYEETAQAAATKRLLCSGP
jgi:exodeoxyribonuclease V alpha subunit